MILTDHGRGASKNGFSGHGAGTRGSGQTWFIAFGQGVPVLGETSNNGPFYEKQLAGTIASVLGIDFQPDNGEKCEPFDPTYSNPAKDEKKVFPFEAIEANPKGSGVRYTYSEGDFLSVESVIKASVKESGVTAFPTTDIKKREDHFGLTFKGLVNIPADGDYTLWLATDDGSRLYWDGQLLFDNDRDGGGFGEAVLQLKAGYHRVELQYFENYGGESIELGMKGPGISAENIPASMWFYE